jgi:glyoxylase-like metal-dependent hydrolase (beta-lactamase superfamily II)
VGAHRFQLADVAPYREGTTHIVMSPLEFIQRLAALVPPPRCIILDIVPIPGHDVSHIAIYDRKTQLLLTGDSLYPGLLVVNDWNAYVRSVARLKDFCDSRIVSFILVAHIEMTNQAGRWFGLGALFQPAEHVLQLEKDHLVELNDALQLVGTHLRTDRHADFIIWPSKQAGARTP